MQAIVCSHYTPLASLRPAETEKPVPGEGEALVRVCASSVNFNTLVYITGRPLFARAKIGLFRPKARIPGSDISGVVEVVGPGVTQFKPGDEIMGELGSCGYGAYAEYACAWESALAPKPANLTHDGAAALPQAGLVALQALRNEGGIQEGQRVLVYGASGGIGTCAVQIARAFGAEVTGVCGPSNLELVRSIGADAVVDYTREDFTVGEGQYDLIVATAGYRPIGDYIRALKPGGTYVVTGGTMSGRNAMKQILEAGMQKRRIEKETGKKVRILSCKIRQEDLITLKEMAEAGKLRPVIDRRYPLVKASEALLYYAKGHARGKVVITIPPSPPPSPSNASARTRGISQS